MDSVDSVDSGAVTSGRRKKWRVSKRNRDWRKRLRLRKTAVQPPTMQSGDKRGPKKIAEEWEQSTVWPSAKEAQQSLHHGAGDSLSFSCSQCRDGSEYVPKDLLRHFEENHRGTPPDFSCHTCTFSTHELSYLQVHLLSHKDTFSSCSICNDNVSRTWPEFSAHLTLSHCQNGKYSCGTCAKFSTGDVGVFLGHMHAHNLGLEGGGVKKSQNASIDTHIKAAHVCPNGNQRKRKSDAHSIATKPNDPTNPKTKPRLTRSAVKEMCWLTQDCLSLPGREFLDKYCHLSDPQTTLEETQQFLKSVAGEAGDQKWTKALQTVLSNVPQDMNLHPKSEHGVNASDLAVLTVQNKITVAQNGATYGKKMKVAPPPEKESPEGGALDAHGVADQNGRDPNLNCPQTETKLHNDDHSEPSESAQTRENRENRELKADQDAEEPEETAHEDGVDISGELKPTNESEAQACVHKVVPKSKRRRRRRRRGRCKRAGKRSAGLPLKMVLKKNPVKEKQWVWQTPSGGGPEGDGDPDPHSEHLKKWTKASPPDSSEAATSVPLKSGDEATAEPPRDADGTPPAAQDDSASDRKEPPSAAEKSRQLVDAAEEVEKVEMSPAAEGASPPGGSSPGSQPQGDSEDTRLALPPVPADSRPDSPALKAVQREPRPAASEQQQPPPKDLQRTLKLVAISPYQLVKRPSGDQPVVVLNHPDADIPEVARIMEVVNRYRGEVQKVVLSRRTVSALSGADDTRPDPTGPNCVQERFLLKMKLRRLSRKKYEVVDAAAAAVSPGGGGGDAAAAGSFRCWFCGRVFSSQEAWIVHRQRHLMEWK